LQRLVKNQKRKLCWDRLWGFYSTPITHIHQSVLNSYHSSRSTCASFFNHTIFIARTSPLFLGSGILGSPDPPEFGGGLGAPNYPHMYTAFMDNQLANHYLSTVKLVLIIKGGDTHIFLSHLLIHNLFILPPIVLVLVLKDFSLKELSIL
jgi:hypothetical protein